MAYPEKIAGQICPDCGAKLVQNPKTNKVFCSAKCWLQDQPAQPPQPINPPPKDESAEGKVRHCFSLEAYKMGKTLTNETVTEINLWTNFVMGGTIAPPKPTADLPEINVPFEG